MSYDYRLLINNEWVASEIDRNLPVNSVWDGSNIGSVAAASSKQATLAIDVADKAFSSWKNQSISDRVEILHNFVRILQGMKIEVAQLLAAEIGKFEEEALNEIDRSLEYIELVIDGFRHMKGRIYYGDIFDKYPRNRKTGLYNRVPLGVILAIAPFNYPINLSITKIAPALISGNTVVLKPSTQGALTSYLFYQRFLEAGLPPGVLNIITGDSQEISDPLVIDERVKLIAFTGSTKVGKIIAQKSLGVPLLFELGGKDVGIVTANADLKIAAENIVSGCFSYSGQRCTAQKLVIVYDSIAENFINEIMPKVEGLKTNPMINGKSADYVEELVLDARDKGAKMIKQGTRNDNFLSASIIDHVKSDMRIAKEEQFGPVLPIIRVKDEAEAIELANSTPYGLQASVYTQDIDEAFRIADKLEVGTVQINAKPDRGPDNFPFGGTKDSGQMMQGTVETIELMTRGKMTVLNLYET